MAAHLLAGGLAGAAGLLVFLIIHHFWIQPIWFILPFGMVIAAAGGVAVGWAYAELLPSLPGRPWTVVALVALIAATLLPAVLLAEIRPPMFDISVPGGCLTMSVGRASLMFIFELLVTAALAGGLAGWLIAGTPRAALASAVAGFIFALGPGHNIPFLAGTPGTLKGLILLTAIVVVASTVLVEGHARLIGLSD